jgi:hypothetical protein
VLQGWRECSDQSSWDILISLGQEEYDRVQVLCSHARFLDTHSCDVIAVGPAVTPWPPHRSRRAVFSHRALQTYSLPHGGFSPQTCLLWPWPPNHPWAFDRAVLADFFGAVPGVALSLPPPIAPLHQDTDGADDARLPPGRRPVHSVVIVVPTERALQPRNHPTEPQMPGRLPPRRNALQGVPALLARGATCARLFARPLLAPMQRTPSPLNPRWRCCAMAPARPPPCLVP